MQRDEIQIEAEKRYAIEEARAEEREKALAEGIAEGEARGKTEGIAEGEAKGKAEVARAMLREELPLETIYRVTGLTETQVQEISKSL